MSTRFVFHGDLTSLPRVNKIRNGSITLQVKRSASVKDTIESFGLPHTEIGHLECDGKSVDFSFPVKNNQIFNVYGIELPWDVTKPTHLRPEPLAMVRFIVDANVGRLVKYLRIAGLDTRFNPKWDDNDIAELAHTWKLIVLSRDLGLLKRRNVQFGRYIRAIKPADQLAEVIGLFNLKGKLNPFSRCLECNNKLVPVPKSKILNRLEPLTRKYYSSFSLCQFCDKVYWEGSHKSNMKHVLGLGDG